jgi:hypothetical protein
VIQNYVIDQAKSFTYLRLLSLEPKTAFGDQFRQETTKDGMPKWEAQLAAGFRQFGKTQNEIIKVGIAAERDPGEGIAPASPVELVDFEIGVMEKTKRDPTTGEERIVGVQVWYRCREIRPIAETPTERKQRTGSNVGTTGATGTEAAS